ADHRPARQGQRVQLPGLFRAQPARQPAELRRRRGALAAVRGVRRRAARPLQPDDPRSERFVTVTGKAYRQRRLRLGAWRVPALCFVSLYVAIAAVFPVAVLLWTSFFGYTPPLAATRDAFSLEAYRQLFANRAFWTGLVNTL